MSNHYPDNWPEIATRVKTEAGWKCIRCQYPNDKTTWHVLTVHHWDGNKANCRWWNLLALCQRCHLKIQSQVDPHQPYMFEHAEWCKIYAAGFYAFKYWNQELTREQAMARLEELLGCERIV